MKPSKPVYLKTYGKQKRKLSAWISPENRKQAFDSTVSSDGDISVFEPPKTTRIRERRTSVASCRAARPAKKKALLCLIEKSFDEENIPSTSCQPAQQSKKTREKRSSVASQRAARPAKKRAALCLKETSSNEENISRLSPPRPQPAQQSLTTSVHLPSAGRFVTRRRRAVSAKPKLPEAKFNILNSSDDSKIHQPSRSAWVPPAFLVSSAENSVNAAGTASFATVSLREMSLNELADQSLGPCPRKPIFCSTPSADSFSKISSSSEEVNRSSEEIKNKNIEELLNLLSTDDSESSCHFVSAVGGLQWLIEALKEKCLTQRCAVQLQRLNNLTVTQLYSQTTYSSCLELSGSVQSRQTKEHSPSVDSGQTVDLSQSSELSFNQNLSVTNNKTSDYLRCLEHAASPSVDCKHSEADAHKSENEHAYNTDDQEDLTGSGDITDRMMPSVRLSINNSSSGGTEEQAAGLKKKCLTDKLLVEVKRLTLSQLKEVQQLKDTTLKSPTDVSDSASDDQKKNDHQSESDTNNCIEDTSAMKVYTKRRGSTRSEDKNASDQNGVVKNSSNVPQKRKKTFQAPKDKKRRSTSGDLPGTTRKACVSGLSVSRWKNKGSAMTHTFRSRTAQTGSNKAVDCSINELISTQHKQPTELLTTAVDFSTPVRASRPTLLADFTPNTHTWSRLKAALSVHRKNMVLLTQSLSGSFGREALADLSQDLFATPFRTPLPKRLRSQLLSSCSLVACEDADLSDAEKVYAECSQQRPLPWEECILPERMKQCVKIGEGTFGEVFSTTNASGDTVALKIIPIEGSEKVNGEDQKTFGEILHEIIISKELSSLKDKQQNQTHGFIGLHDLHCVQGCYPPDFINAWDNFDQQKGSENDRPDFFETDQLFLILEFEFGGSDLENSNGTLSSLGVAKSILHQVTAALAVAEQELHFEHRDLHWGNVLVKTTKQKTGSFLLNGAAHSLETKGVLVRIIDYSLSRLEIDELTVSCDISKDEELFMGQGDYQFDIYRLMRQENGNNWSNYHPHTNVLWLHYLCSKLLSMKYRGFGGRGAKDMREELTRFYDNVLQYSSATETLQNCPMFQ